MCKRVHSLLTTALAVAIVLSAGCGVVEQSAPTPAAEPLASSVNASAVNPAPTGPIVTAEERETKIRHDDTRLSLHKRRQIAESRPALAGMIAADQAVNSYAIAPHPAPIRAPSAGIDRERYGEIQDNPVHAAAEDPVSTFSIDVDTGAYSLVRRHLNGGQLPPTDAVRTEELINYFNYDYPAPTGRKTPFSVTTELAPAPWNEDAVLLHVGIQGLERETAERPDANLVFLLDVSGSMNSPNKLPLLKSALSLATHGLSADDRVSIVVYAGASGVVLEPTPGNQKAKICAALNQLSAGGSTHGSAGIELAYSMAEQGFIDGGINRVILATDGDFNVGTVNHEQLIDLIERQRDSGITLTTLGFGAGNYNDHLMEQLADHGNGHYAYIDNIGEAQKVLVDELASTLETIASDVKIQIEWNPAVVAEYRLIGYENRLLAREDFNNDKVDAGDIGAGHSVTALYEIVLNDSDARRLPPLRYGKRDESQRSHGHELAHLKLRYKMPGKSQSTLLTETISRDDIGKHLARSSDDFRFSAAVAGFGQLLRGGRYTGDFDYADVGDLAKASRGEDAHGYRGEFQRLVRLAASLNRS